MILAQGYYLMINYNSYSFIWCWKIPVAADSNPTVSLKKETKYLIELFDRKFVREGP